MVSCIRRIQAYKLKEFKSIIGTWTTCRYFPNYYFFRYLVRHFSHVILICFVLKNLINYIYIYIYIYISFYTYDRHFSYSHSLLHVSNINMLRTKIKM